MVAVAECSSGLALLLCWLRQDCHFCYHGRSGGGTTSWGHITLPAVCSGKNVVRPRLSRKNQYITSSPKLRYVQIQVYKIVLAEPSNAFFSKSYILHPGFQFFLKELTCVIAGLPRLLGLSTRGLPPRRPAAFTNTIGQGFRATNPLLCQASSTITSSGSQLIGFWHALAEQLDCLCYRNSCCPMPKALTVQACHSLEVTNIVVNSTHQHDYYIDWKFSQTLHFAAVMSTACYQSWTCKWNLKVREKWLTVARVQRSSCS